MVDSNTWPKLCASQKEATTHRIARNKLNEISIELLDNCRCLRTNSGASALWTQFH